MIFDFFKKILKSFGDFFKATVGAFLMFVLILIPLIPFIFIGFLFVKFVKFAWYV